MSLTRFRAGEILGFELGMSLVFCFPLGLIDIFFCADWDIF